MVDSEERELLAPFQRHSKTSLAAAISVHEQKSQWRLEVLQFLEDRGEGGATDQEIEVALGKDKQTIGPRRVELCRAGLVMDSGERRLTRAGRKAVVWIATPEDVDAPPFLPKQGNIRRLRERIAELEAELAERDGCLFCKRPTRRVK